MSTPLINEITAKGFDPHSLYPATATAEAAAKRNEILALKADAGCLVGCVIQFILCMDSNPGQGSTVCNVQYQNCLSGCQGLGS